MERIAGCPNLRDMGGIKVKNGYVKPGRLIRSGALWRLEDKDIEKLGSIAAVYDMRSENERAYHPDPGDTRRGVYTYTHNRKWPPQVRPEQAHTVG